MSKIKMVATDIDGTILGSSRVFTKNKEWEIIK